MSEIDKMARDLLAAEFAGEGAGYCARGIMRKDPQYDFEVAAIRKALLAAPPGWKLVPIPPTDEMLDAAQDAHMPFGDMHFAITSAILAAPEPK